MVATKTIEAIEIIDKKLATFFGKRNKTILIQKAYQHYILNSQNSIGETSDSKGRYNLWAFPVKSELSDIALVHPLYFALSVKLKENDEIEELNIKLFKEDKDKTKDTTFIPTHLLLRVEWSNVAQEKHAQPHWHIHSYSIVDKLEGFDAEKRNIFLSLFEEEVQNPQSIFEELQEDNNNEIIEQENVVKKEIPEFRFHLTMLADWHKEDKSSHINELTNEKLSIWLPQCLNYIKGQVEYILERMQ